MQRVRAVSEADKVRRQARKTKTGEVAFVKGGAKPEGSGRKKGQLNKHSRVLKDITFKAMEMVGYDGKGKDEAEGYLARIAEKHPELFMQLLVKIIPYSLAGAGGGPVQVEYTNREELTLRIKERGLPMPMDLLAPPKRKPAAEVMDAQYTEVEEEA